jgi:3-oxosteroid 1-dehydrogenase
MTSGWDHIVDVLVVGSGAGAMVAALTAHDRGATTLLIEKATEFGGSSARSGGGIWIPNNHLMRSAGIEDDPADAITYLKAVTRGIEPEDRLDAFVKHAPEMIRYLCAHTRVRLHCMPKYPDYYPSHPGWRPGGRGIESDYFDGRLLGNEILRLHCYPGMERIKMTINEAHGMLTRQPGWWKNTLTIAIKYALDVPWRFRSTRGRHLAMGPALIGTLRRSLMDRSVPLWLSTPARELVREHGRVVGVVAERDGRLLRIRAEKGVVLATGGFESAQAMRERYLPKPTSDAWTAGSPHNTGDAIGLGLAVGARIDLMDYVCWMPVNIVPGEDSALPLLFERTLPGSYIVNQRGERFVDEALPYIDTVKAMYGNNPSPAPNVPAYMIFDATFRRKYPLGPILPGSAQPDWLIPKRLRGRYLTKAGTVAELAQLLRIDAAGLTATVAKVNRYARTGVDLDFHRGENTYDRFYGDPAVQPNPCLGPVETSPFYAITVYPGDIGTMGGLKTDAHAQVVTEQAAVIPGLYAVGNCSASAIGGTYPGPGSTLGPAMTFGYIAARHATQTAYVDGRRGVKPTIDLGRLQV